MPPRPAGRPSAVLTAAATAAVVTTAAALLAPADPAAAAGGQYSSAQLIRLAIANVPALHAGMFQGVYGTADSPVVDAPDDDGDFSDPDGVLNHVTLDGATVVRSSNTSGKAYGQTLNSGMTLYIRDNDPLLQVRPVSGSVATVDTYAECTPPPVGPYALAYARTAGNQIMVAGHTVGVGTTTLDVTGTDLHEPATLGDSTLTVDYRPHEVPSTGGQTPGVYQAEAWIDITVTGVLNDLTGNQVYSGPITTLRLGEVHASCLEKTSPTPSPSESKTPTPSPSESKTPTPSPSESVTPSPSPSESVPPSPSPSPTGGLPDTGSSAGGPVATIALVLLVGGVAAVGVARLGRRRRRH
ncbi:hypothetical protein [Streptacidiphilus sp. P02-A3a]|uniref:hypothetical protein n=1 Tax=Streptacidiphilus sp. P02-A3a TaxID=2704468 RepID=UPI0015FA9284|nr:hypothetical protein [Streptacidiphilus sp. P02-A3a]QMU69099.1 hypothetical protein GXP74_13460 [Streptacidiphilus sp. P02-A3a]